MLNYFLIILLAGCALPCDIPTPDDPDAGPYGVCQDVEYQGGGTLCRTRYENCGEGHIYAFTCHGDGCRCAVDGRVTIDLGQVIDTCPIDVETVNRLCGWILE